MHLSLDIHTAVQTALIIVVILILILFLRGYRLLRSAKRLPFFRLRRDRTILGWRLLLSAIGLIFVALFLNFQMEPLVYKFYPPTSTITLTPTITLSPTISLTPTITLSPTITLTPLVSNTPTITPTPYIPLAIADEFASTVTPNPEARFSELTFTQEIDAMYRATSPEEAFTNPVGHLYAVFTYDQMLVGSQWSALWFRNGELVFYETKTWDAGTGGFGYTDWNPDAVEWQPGYYEVQIFNGMDWKVSGFFTVTGEPPTPTLTNTATTTPTVTNTRTATRTLWPTKSPQPTRTPRPTSTSSPVPSATATRIPYKSPTISPTITTWPTSTPRPTKTRRPTWTITISPTITITRTPYIKPSITLSPTPYPTLTRTPVTPSITPQPTRTRTITPTTYPTQTRTRTPIFAY